MKKLLLFKAGKYPQGSWTAEELSRVVESHASGKLPDIPLVIAHRASWEQTNDKDEFAYGWIYALEQTSGGLYATDFELSDELKELIATKKLRYMSVELVRGNAEDGGSPYIAAVALLGRNNPAVSLARLPEMFSKMKAWVGGKNNDAQTTIITEIDRDVFETAEANDENYEKEKGAVVMDKETVAVLQKENTVLKSKLEAFEAEKKELLEKQKLLEAKTFYQGLCDEGKIFPAQVEQFAQIEMVLPEKEKGAQRDLASSFSAGVGNLLGKPEKSNGKSNIADEIAHYAKEHTVSYEDAAKIVYEKNASLFQEGEKA